MPFCMQMLCHLAVLANFVTFSVAAVTGSVAVDPSEKGVFLQVRARSRDGALIESSPVTENGFVYFHSLPKQPDGVYVLQLYGAMSYEYHPILVLLQDGAVKSAMLRSQPLIVPPRIDSPAWPRTSEIEFKPFVKTNYAKKAAPWRLRDMWNSKLRLLQLFALIFVVWFPQFIRELPKDLREELMGEKEEDIGDPNAVVKTLIGREDVGPNTTSEST